MRAGEEGFGGVVGYNVPIFYVFRLGVLRFEGGVAAFSGWGYYICGFLMLRGCYVFRVEGGVVTTIRPHRSPLLKAIFNVLYAHANQSCKCTGAGSSAAQKTWTRNSPGSTVPKALCKRALQIARKQRSFSGCNEDKKLHSRLRRTRRPARMCIYYIILYYIMLCYVILYCITWYYIISYYNIYIYMYCIVLYCIVLYIILYYIILYYIRLDYIEL